MLNFSGWPRKLGSPFNWDSQKKSPKWDVSLNFTLGVPLWQIWTWNPFILWVTDIRLKENRLWSLPPAHGIHSSFTKQVASGLNSPPSTAPPLRQDRNVLDSWYLNNLALLLILSCDHCNETQESYYKNEIKTWYPGLVAFEINQNYSKRARCNILSLWPEKAFLALLPPPMPSKYFPLQWHH